MKVVQINATCGSGSTGKICVSISQILTENNIENYILYCSGSSDYPLSIKCSSKNYIKKQAFIARILGNWGFNSNKSTKKMISELERIKPDIVHLHNIHGHDCNLELLFDYFRKKKIKLFWTFHDCWAITGYCMHFMMCGCERWKTECGNCPQRKEYSWFLDRSDTLHNKKKALFSGLDLTVITPSQWIADVVRKSFLRNHTIIVIHNGIDLTIFNPTESNFRDKYHIESKYIVLGVAFGWGKKKGLDIFIELANRLDDQYQIVLVGTSATVDKLLPDNIISIHRTQNQKELAEIYSSADIFVNASREENYPTVNMEAVACGTPVIAFKTGGSPETIDDSCGWTVTCDDVVELKTKIIVACQNKPFDKGNCIKKSMEFNENERFKEYLELYERVRTE